jgi:hypothetical protein
MEIRPRDQTQAIPKIYYKKIEIKDFGHEEIIEKSHPHLNK